MDTNEINSKLGLLYADNTDLFEEHEILKENVLE